MANDPTEEMVKKEIAAAAAILREDGHSVRLSKIEEKLAKAFPDDPEVGKNGNTSPPPKKEEGENAQPPKKGLWWGEHANE